MPLLVAAQTVPPVAWATPNPSLFAPTPMFLNVSVSSNVLFVLDDSLSMEDIRLPVPTSPAGLDPQESLGGTVMVGGGLVVDRVNEWIHRTALFNPLYYNPEITYRPWNDNGRGGQSGNFTNASTSVTSHSNGFREGLVPQDMRYVGPNYTAASGSSAQRQRLRTATGANPPGAPIYLATTRPANAGFTGTVFTDSSVAPARDRNQDIFSSPLVWVAGSAESCTTTTFPNSTAQPWQARPSTPLPTADRGTQTRASTDRGISDRDTTTRESRSRPTADLPVSDRPSATVTSASRSTTNRPSANRLSSTRETYTRESISKPSYSRDIVSRGVQYRTETPNVPCGTWTSWETRATPPNVDGQVCGDIGSGELGVRQIQWESQAEPCASGYSVYTTNSCIKNCATGETASGTQCVQPCSGSYPDASGDRCYASCPTTHPIAHPTQNNTCMAGCPTGYTAGTGANVLVCTGGCPTTHPTQIGNSCYGGCPTTHPTINSNLTTQCLADCPASTPNVASNNNLLCVANCPADKPTAIGATCYGSCPTDTPTVNPGNPAQCLGSCPNNAPNPVDGTLTCVGNCNGRFGNLIGSLCYEDCPSGYPSYNPNNAAQCLADCPTSYPTIGSNILKCLANCPTDYPTPRTADGKCYANCSGQFPTQNPNNNIQCLANCSGDTPSVDGSNNLRCIGSCPSTHATQSGSTCYGNCPDTHPTVNASDAGRCMGACPSGTTLSGANCVGCPTGTEPFGTSNLCCPTGSIVTSNCPLQLPEGTTCTSGDRYYIDLDRPALARYYRFQPQATNRAPTASELNNPAYYALVEINRDRNASRERYQATFDKPYKNNDPTQGRAEREDCGDGDTCTWEQEAQNFANWYTYYRNRLFSAIGVTSEALSGLTAESTLDSLRLGYGSLNYFPGGADPYSTTSGRLPSSMTIDGQSSVGTLVRGVRPFTQTLPAPAPGSSNSRQEVFDWLFSVRGVGATPTREAVDAIGRYLARTDNRGPWIDDRATTAAAWQTTEESDDHISCRRNYAIIISDGEWTKVPAVTPPQQPRIESRTSAGLPDSFLASQEYLPTTAITVDGPTHTGGGLVAGREYTYSPSSEVHISQVTGSPTGTLSDATLYWWSRDLRPDLLNNIGPIDEPAERRNEAFWQSLTTYIVGYGISASRDTAATRSAAAARSAISWPPVNTAQTVVTDNDAACVSFASTEPASGCGRRNDVLRAALASRGDFLSATDVAALAREVAAVFGVIAEQEGSGTGLVSTATRVTSDDRIFQASFISRRWSGQLEAFDAAALFAAATAGTAAPDPLWRANFPVYTQRTLLTSTEDVAGGVAFADIDDLTDEQADQIGSQDVLDYLRGDQSKEIGQTNGVYRRRLSLLADIVNSQPLYSRARDFFYSSARAPAAAALAAASYPAYVTSKQSTRRAAIYVGANGGIFHAFDAADGKELFGYVPRAVYGQLNLLSRPEYDHRYFVDGPSVEGDAYLNNAWRTIMVGTTGVGGTWSAGSARLGGSIFALDVTDPTSMTAQKVLWDLTGADNDDIGHILQPGVIGSAKDGNWYYFVGNGYESQNDKARLLAINLSTGNVLSLATDDAGGSDPADSDLLKRPNGLGGVTPVYDRNRNIVAIYAGDRLGRLWKFDLSAATSATELAAVTGTKLFEARDGSTAAALRQPITAAPRVMEHPFGGRYIAFGTGKFFERLDRDDLSVQSIYVLWEKNPSSPAEIARSSLRELTLAGDGRTADTDGQCTASDGARVGRVLGGQGSIDFTTDLGFYFDLIVGTETTGERVLVTPVEDAGFVNFSTFEPLAGGDACAGGGRSFAYRLDLAGGFTRAAFADRNKQCVAFSLQEATVGNQALLGTPVSGSGCTGDDCPGPTRVLKRAGLEKMLETLSPHLLNASSAGVGSGIRSGLTGTVGFGSPNNSLRVWRELPRE